MADVLKFERPARPEPTLSGRAQCLCCDYQWEAVAPVGTQWIECPECHTMRGTWRHAVEGSPGDTELRCTFCNSNAMTAIRRNGFSYILCMGCGVDHTESLFG